ncbi:MAG: hypothetical protein A2X52_21990 [Candidatus Rokubacteria bacterium GWC2_70_16]|nr:MAG: hypothetical protein A2X52_21990 [Candidatus Rokubacteria bacterium GWC2_70_16]OGL13981.1 MAG: hypothetical protein A3K12_11960 [Candidatus Rokubacteria bacterium RIFCSPLOWO2_12_FULL_71_19]
MLSTDFLAQLERLALLSRRSFRGRVKGERRSPRKGHSVEFSDYRPYGPGDDLRYVDWNIYGRLDRLYVKLFVDEEDLCLHLLLDASASMGVGEPSKLAYAARLAAALGFVGLVNHERVGVGALRGRLAEGWAPARGRTQAVPLMDFLGRLRSGGGTSLNESLATYALRAREAGLAVLVSDLLDPGGYERGLKALLERRFDVHVIHLLAAEEMSPTFGGDLRLLDLETGEERDLTLDGDALRGYRQRLHDFLERAEGFCRANEISYHRVVTATPVEEFMLRQLKGFLLA